MIGPMERIHPGMHVMSVDGQHVGRVASVDASTVRVLSGRRALEVPAEEVASVLEHEVFLRLALRRYLPRYHPHG